MNLSTKTIGTGPSITILHGLFGDKSNWNTLAKALSETHKVTTVDQRNHGNSPHTPTHSYPEMAQDLESIITDPTHLIGHSMGGKTAIEFTTKYPELIQKLIIIDIAPVDYPPHHDDVLAALNAVPLKDIKTRSDALPYLEAHLEDKRLDSFFLKSLKKADTGYKWQFNLPVLEKDYINISKAPNKTQINAPTLFLKGESSDYINKANIPIIKAQFPNAQIKTIPKTGHWLHAEAPEASLREIKDFLNQAN